MALRLILQPTMATLLAVRAGLKDARAGRRPYLSGIATKPTQRRELIREGWKDVRKVFLIALALDVVYQTIVFRWVYVVQAVVTAVVLAIVPYLLLRGIATRVASRVRSGRAGS
jgi:magnesium-transporting ATPase (P-type)